MELSYWQGRWDRNEVAFHEGVPNDLLVDAVERARLLAGRKRVLVPLCGKSVDMAYLAHRGLGVVGVEAVSAACEQFFAEQKLPRTVEKRGPHKAHVGKGIEIVEADMFAVKPEHVGTFDAAYDRASLIALAPETRTKYVDAVHALLKPNARMLLITIRYDQTLTPGPPWSIDDRIVKILFTRKGFVVEKLRERAAEIRSKLKEAGVKAAHEGVYLLTRL